MNAVRSIVVSLMAAGALGAGAAHAQTYPSLFSKRASSNRAW